MIRRHVYYSGSVQGVGFRYTTVRVAANYRVGGFVRNMMDGRVEVVVEGQASEVDRFLADLAGAMRNYISEQKVINEPYNKGEFEGFDIRF